MKSPHNNQNGAVITYVLIFVGVIVVIGVLASLLGHGTPTKTNEPKQAAQVSTTPTPTATPAASLKYSPAQAENLVQHLWGGYNSETATRQDVINSSNASVQGYINTTEDYDPITCAQNNLYSGLSYSQPQVSDTTATIDVTEEPGLVVEVSVDLNSLLISNIYCPIENPQPSPPF